MSPEDPAAKLRRGATEWMHAEAQARHERSCAQAQLQRVKAEPAERCSADVLAGRADSGATQSGACVGTRDVRYEEQVSDHPYAPPVPTSVDDPASAEMPAAPEAVVSSAQMPAAPLPPQAEHALAAAPQSQPVQAGLGEVQATPPQSAPSGSARTPTATHGQQLQDSTAALVHAPGHAGAAGDAPPAGQHAADSSAPRALEGDATGRAACAAAAEAALAAALGHGSAAEGPPVATNRPVPLSQPQPEPHSRATAPPAPAAAAKSTPGAAAEAARVQLCADCPVQQSATDREPTSKGRSVSYGGVETRGGDEGPGAGCLSLDATLQDRAQLRSLSVRHQFFLERADTNPGGCAPHAWLAMPEFRVCLMNVLICCCHQTEQSLFDSVHTPKPQQAVLCL